MLIKNSTSILRFPLYINQFPLWINYIDKIDRIKYTSYVEKSSMFVTLINTDKVKYYVENVHES